MPLHDVGYRPWDDKKTPGSTRWTIIGETGFRLAFKSAWVKRLMFIAWVPVLYWGIAFFWLESSLSENGFIRGVTERAQQSEVFTELQQSPEFERILSELKSRGLSESEIERVMENPELIRIRDSIGRQGRDSVQREFGEVLREEFDWIPFVGELAKALESDDESVTRHVIWSFLLMTLFRYPQALLILFLIGFVGPSLISRDIRSRAFLLYFSKPIGPFEYVLGKFSVLATFIALVTTLPAITLYFFAVMLSPDLSVVASTWDIPFRIIAATIVLVIPISSLILMLSSLTQETRFASFAWFAIWALGHAAWFAVAISQAIRMRLPPVHEDVLSSEIVQRFSVLSLYNNLGDIQNWIFGFSKIDDVWPGILALAIITVVSLAILFRRIRASIQA